MKDRIYFLVRRTVNSSQQGLHDTDKGWEKLREKTILRTRRGRNARRWAYAAACAAGIGFFILYPLRRDNETIVAENTIVESSRPELMLPDGTRVSLADHETVILDEYGISIQPGSGGDAAQYTVDPVVQGDPDSYSKFIIPKGCEYTLKLPDGSTVWLNSESTLRIPSSFSGGNRLVFLEGEAFFNVAKNGASQFRVITGEREITVLGTSFNVSAYPDDALWHTTLVEGRVSISAGGVEKILNPSEQCSIDNSTGLIEVKRVETQPYTSWVKGQIYFKGFTFEDVVAKLERWYDFTLVYGDEEIKQMKFRGCIDRNRSLEETLRILEATTNIQFVITESLVTVRKTNRSE